MDVALVQYINRLCRHLAITPARLHPHEVYLDPADAADPRVACLLSMWALGAAPMTVEGGRLEGLEVLFTAIEHVLRLTCCDPWGQRWQLH